RSPRNPRIQPHDHERNLPLRRRLAVSHPGFARFTAPRRRSADYRSVVRPPTMELGQMQGDAEIIEVLNEILTAELTAINQYFIHAKMRENWGFPRLAAVARKESIEEMEDA